MLTAAETRTEIIRRDPRRIDLKITAVDYLEAVYRYRESVIQRLVFTLFKYQ